jgi:hypothetical protein
MHPHRHCREEDEKRKRRSWRHWDQQSCNQQRDDRATSIRDSEHAALLKESGL